MKTENRPLSWESATLTWNNQPLYNTTHDLSYSPLAERYSPTSAWYVLDVTNIVASWVDGLRSNYGFALVDITEDDEDHWTTYYSSDMESPHKPELHITYNGPSTPDEPDDPVNPPATTPTQGISSGQTYYIKNVFSGKYLEADVSLNNNVIQNDFDGYSNQQWKVVYEGNGVYKLYNQYAGYINDHCCLDLVSQNDNGIDLYADSDSPRVLFYILLNSDGSFRIQNSWVTTEAVLTVPDALSLSDVTNSDWVNSSKQKWVFELATTKLSTYRTFSAFDIGDSSQDEVSLVSQYLTNYGYTNLGTYNNADHYISAQNIKDIGRYSDVVYINGHGGRYANLWVQYDGDGDGIIDEDPIEYLCADDSVNTNNSLNKIGIGAQWKPGSTTKTTSYWNQKTKWVILAECSQLNYGTEEGAGNHWNGLNSAQVWARTMLGDGVRIHGILGYYEYAPAADAHLAKLENFFNTSSQVSIIKAWKSVHNTLVGTANWAMLYHSENSSDRLSSFTENTTNGSDYTIYLVSRSHDTETDLSLSVLAMPTNTSVDLNDFPTFINTSTYNAQSIHESMKSKLPLGNNEQLTIDEFGKITYLNSSVDLGSADLNYLLTDEEAIDIAERYLLQLGIFPEGSYRTSVNKTERRTLNLIDNQFSSPEVIEYSVCFYRTYNGIDLLSDQDDGIIVSFNKEGLTELKYLWREIELVTNGPDERMEALSMNQGVMISKEQAQDIYRNNIDELLSGNTTEPVITTAYLQLNNTVRPVYVFSTDYHYANSIFIDMYTGEVLVV